MSDPLRIVVLIGSIRDERLGPTVAAWFTGLAAARDDLVLDVVDLAHEDLPGVLPAGHPSRGEYPDAVLPFAARLAAADGFVIVTPEYNHGYPGALKDAIDLVGPEWHAKPVSFVAYGGLSGGIRAVEQLRQVMAEVHAVTLRDAVYIPFARKVFAGGDAPADEDGRIADAVALTLRRLSWWGRALRAARTVEPYGR